MNQSKGVRDVGLISKVMMLAGVAAIIAGVIFHVSAPAEKRMGDDGWFESVEARNEAQFAGTGLIMFGAFGLLAGAMFSARGRRAALALSRESMQAVGEGLSAGFGTNPAARLERLESLHRDGTLTDDEYRRKRAEIVAQL